MPFSKSVLFFFFFFNVLCSFYLSLDSISIGIGSAVFSDWALIVIADFPPSVSLTVQISYVKYKNLVAIVFIALANPFPFRRRKWQPISVFLPGEFHGQRSLGGYNLWGHKESVMTE